MALLPVEEALRRLLDGAEPLAAELVPLASAAYRVLARPLRALRRQPPFDASAMDGYAVRSADLASAPIRLKVIAEAAAGRRFSGAVGSGEAVRIFTGAPVPEGADTILIQENVQAHGDGTIGALEAVGAGRHIRRAGLDFREGELLLEAGRILDGAALSLAAAANHAEVAVVRKPVVAILAIGDELLSIGSEPGPDQIIASNPHGVGAIAKAAGADVLDLGIAPDAKDRIATSLREGFEAGVDVVVTLGGASVGDHDLVHAVLGDMGVAIDFWKIAMRPGKPLMFGRLSATRILGLPGNPVASLVCSHVFLKPLIARLAGREFRLDLREAIICTSLQANDQRQDYVRAVVVESSRGLAATPHPVQDSSMLKTLAASNALIVREPFAAALKPGEACRVIMLG